MYAPKVFITLAALLKAFMNSFKAEVTLLWLSRVTVNEVPLALSFSKVRDTFGMADEIVLVGLVTVRPLMLAEAEAAGCCCVHALAAPVL